LEQKSDFELYFSTKEIYLQKGEQIHVTLTQHAG